MYYVDDDDMIENDNETMIGEYMKDSSIEYMNNCWNDKWLHLQFKNEKNVCLFFILIAYFFI